MTFHKSIVPQNKRKPQHHPFQAEYSQTQSTSQLQYNNPVFFPYVRLQVPQEIGSSGQYEHRNRALEYGRQHHRYHVSYVAFVGTRSGDGGARDGTGDGDDVEEDKEEAT